MGEGLITVASQSRASGRARFWLALLYPIIVVALYWETIGSMVSIWQRSDTYAHGYLILPITLCLIWMKRDALSGLKLQPALSVQLLLIPGGLVWLLSYLTDVLVIQQLALVGILIVGIWSIVGHSVARIIAFPLGFLLLAVPMGEDLVPPMMEFTASSTVWLIKLDNSQTTPPGMSSSCTHNTGWILCADRASRLVHINHSAIGAIRYPCA